MYPILFKGTMFRVVSGDFCLLLGMIIAITYGIIKRPDNFPISRIGILICAFLMTILGLYGAKLLYIFIHWQQLLKEAQPILYVFPSLGYAALGALTGEFMAIFLFAKIRIRKVSFLEISDFIAPFAFLQLAITRIGCFLGGCCFGKPTELPWGCVFKAIPGIKCHPTQLYSFLFLICIFCVTRFVYRKSSLIKGITFFSALGLYGFFRFFVEFLRSEAKAVVWCGFTLVQVFLLILSVSSIFAIAIIFTARKNDE